MKKSNRNGNVILRKVISFEGELKNLDILESTKGKAIVYFERDKGFIVLTNDPLQLYLTEKDINSQWIKYSGSSLKYCMFNIPYGNTKI